MHASHRIVIGFIGTMGLALGPTGCGPDQRVAARQRPTAVPREARGPVMDADELEPVSPRPSRAAREAVDDAEKTDPRRAMSAVRRRIEDQGRALETARAPRAGAIDPAVSVAAAPAARAAVMPPPAEAGSPFELSLPASPRKEIPAADETPSAGTNQPVAVSARPPEPVPRVVKTDDLQIPGANQAVTSSATAAGGDDALSRRIGQHVKDYPRDLPGHLDYQLLRLLRDEPAPDLQAMTGLAAEDKEVLSALIDGLNNFRTGARADANQLTSRKVRPLIELGERARTTAELNIPTMLLCKEVRGFGVYETMANDFKAGQDNALVIYCEVENFSSRQNTQSLWETKLSQEVVLYTETGFPVWRDKSVLPPDLTRSHRRDFYIFKKITLPKTLSVGRYVLKMSIVDEQVKRVAENSVAINILAQ